MSLFDEGLQQLNRPSYSSSKEKEEDLQISLQKSDWFEVLEALSLADADDTITQGIRRQLNQQINGKTYSG